MPCDDWLHCRCYKRRTILGLALAPLLAGSARAAEEGEVPGRRRRTIALCF
jgi:rieske iron-sulfur protein